MGKNRRSKKKRRPSGHNTQLTQLTGRPQPGASTERESSIKRAKTWVQRNLSRRSRSSSKKAVDRSVSSSKKAGHRSTSSTRKAVEPSESTSSTSLQREATERKVSELQCSICLNRIENLAKADNCLHQFCRGCIMEWSKRSNQCPVCRTIFNTVIFNIKSDSEYESVPIERPRMAIIPIVNVFRDITVSPDGRNATVRTRYLTRDGIREITEVRDLNSMPSTSTSPPLAQIARENGLQSMVNSFLQDIAARNRELPQTERLPLPPIPHARRPPMPDDDDDDDDDFVI